MDAVHRILAAFDSAVRERQCCWKCEVGSDDSDHDHDDSSSQMHRDQTCAMNRRDLLGK